VLQITNVKKMRPHWQHPGSSLIDNAEVLAYVESDLDTFDGSCFDMDLSESDQFFCGVSRELDGGVENKNNTWAPSLGPTFFTST